MNEEMIYFRNGGSISFKEVFEDNIKFCRIYALKKIKDINKADEIAASVLVKLWKSRDKIDDNAHVKRFLVAAIRTTVMDVIRHHKKQSKYFKYTDPHEIPHGKTDNDLIYADLMSKIWEAYELLPTKDHKTVFRLYYRDNLIPQEISEAMLISVKKVYNLQAYCIKFIKKQLITIQ